LRGAGGKAPGAVGVCGLGVACLDGVEPEIGELEAGECGFGEPEVGEHDCTWKVVFGSRDGNIEAGELTGVCEVELCCCGCSGTRLEVDEQAWGGAVAAVGEWNCVWEAALDGWELVLMARDGVEAGVGRRVVVCNVRLGRWCPGVAGVVTGEETLPPDDTKLNCRFVKLLWVVAVVVVEDDDGDKDRAEELWFEDVFGVGGVAGTWMVVVVAMIYWAASFVSSASRDASKMWWGRSVRLEKPDTKINVCLGLHRCAAMHAWGWAWLSSRTWMRLDATILAF
jgi:hypothetical protein